MIGAIVIRMVGRKTGTTRDHSLASRPMRAAPHIHFTKHERRGTFTVSAIYPANDFALVRATGVIGTYLELQSNQTARLPAIPFISVRLPRADAGGLRGWSSLAFRRRLNLFGAFKALRAVFLGISFALQACKQSARCFAQCLRSFSCAVLHDRNTSTGLRAWLTEKLSLSSIKWSVRS